MSIALNAQNTCRINTNAYKTQSNKHIYIYNFITESTEISKNFIQTFKYNF